MTRFAVLLASAAFVTPALAADVIYEEPMAPAPAPVAFEPAFTWTGFYVGGQAGVAFNNEAVDFGDDDDFFDDDSSFVGGGDDGDTAFIGGVHVGYDYQINNFIVGAVADINYIDAESQSSFTVPATIDGVDGFATFGSTQEIDYVGTVRGKLGFAADRFAIYATGGLAYAGVNNESFGGGSFVSDGTLYDVTVEEDSDDFGYAVGAGVDYLVTENLSIGIEYLYHDLGSSEVEFNYTEVDGDGSLDFSSSSNDDLDFHTVWAKASFRFN